MLLVPALMVVAGFGLLLGGGELLVRGAVALAGRFGLSSLCIGVTVVACATSMPELVVTVSAGLGGRPDLALGNIIGSNVANVLLILGAVGLIGAIQSPEGYVRRDGFVMLGATLLFTVLALVSHLDWRHGLLFLLLLAAYVVARYRSERTAPVEASPMAQEASEVLEVAPTHLGIAVLLVLLGGGALALGAELLIDGAVEIAQTLGVSEAVIGLTLIAIGTSLPELATGIVAALRRHGDVAVGNVIGSNIFNLLGILGALALTTPVILSDELRRFDLWAMLGASLMLLVFVLGARPITRPVAMAFLLLYGGFILVQFLPS